MKVSDLMTSEVITLDPDDLLGLAERHMRDSSIRHIPVVDEDFKLVGLITQRDLLGASLSSLHRASEADSRMKSSVSIKQVMQRDLETCGPDDTLQDACDTLRHKKVGCLPVVDGEGKLVGILTDSDFLRLAALFLTRFDADPRTAEAVQAASDAGGA